MFKVLRRKGNSYCSVRRLQLGQYNGTEEMALGLQGTKRIRESVDSLCRDGADTQYMQYLSKSCITSPQTHKKLI